MDLVLVSRSVAFLPFPQSSIPIFPKPIALFVDPDALKTTTITAATTTTTTTKEKGGSWMNSIDRCAGTIRLFDVIARLQRSPV
jgi:hypothetical protein